MPLCYAVQDSRALAVQRSYTATVSAADGVVFAAAAESPRELLAAVVEYIRGRCDHVLWPGDAMRVRTLIDGDRMEAAIASYFARVGDRWDAERLELGGGAR